METLIKAFPAPDLRRKAANFKYRAHLKANSRTHVRVGKGMIKYGKN